MPTIFSRIINREIPGWVVAEDEFNIAFLDINPLVVGHCLVVPKKEVDYYYDLADSDFELLNQFSKKVAYSIKKAISCERIGVVVMGLEVPHCHIHLIPIQTMHDMNFSRPKLVLSKEEFEKTTNSIKQYFLG